MGKTGCCSRDRVLLSKALIQLSADGRGWCPPGSCLAWGDPALGSASSIVGLMVNSKRLHAKGDLLVTLFLWWAPANPSLHRRPSNMSRLYWFSLRVVTASLLCVLMHTKFCLCPPKTGVSGSLSPLEGLWSNPTDPQGQIPWGFSVPLLDPQAGIQNLHNNARTSLALLFSSLWVTHLAGMGFDFIVIASLLLSCCCFFVFERGVSFFGGFQCPPVDCFSTANCNFGALAGGGKHTPSTLPSWAGRPVVFYIYLCCYFY